MTINDLNELLGNRWITVTTWRDGRQLPRLLQADREI